LSRSLPRRWVSWGLTASFFLALVSGLIVSYPFREEIPLVSTVGLETVIPFGAFFRAFHYYTGQLTFLLLGWHLVEALMVRAEKRRSPRAWFFLVGSLPLVTLALFTGYIVRGDQTGLSAGQIAEHLALKLPFLGVVVNRLLFSISEEGVHRAFMAHIYLSLAVFVLSGLWHFRLRTLRLDDLLLWFLLAGILALFWPVSLEAESFAPLIKGPWFFLGVQELLRHLPPFWAGVVFPLLPLLALWLYRFCPRVAGMVLSLWLGIYFWLTCVGAWR